MAKDTNALFAEERQQQMLAILNKERKLSITDLCERFALTPPTARNDLRELESKGLLKRTHGGAIPKEESTFEVSFFRRETENVREKQSIARYASTLVHDGDAIIIDSGTTTFEFAKCLCEKQNLTVVTCDLKVAMYLQDNSDAHVILLGGSIRKDFYCTSGVSVLSMLRTLCADACFLGASGVTAERGVTTPGAEHAEIRRCMMEVSARTIVLCDSRKIGINGFCVVSPLDKIDLLVTDDGISEEDKRLIEETGVELHVTGNE